MDPQMDKNPEVIKSMFSSVAQKYDQANSVLSLGVHHLWRAEMVKWAQLQKGQSVLDCATGTGDLAIEFKKSVGAEGRVVGTDFCPEMLELAPAKALRNHLKIEFQVADVMNLPYEDQQFDLSSISFGIRNVSDPVKGISEMARVVKPGGTVMVLEFGQMKIPLLSSFYNFYSQKVLPQIGGLVTGQPQAYEYLQKSSADFPCRTDFVRLMRKTGRFTQIEYKTLSFGIAYIYKGTVKSFSEN